MGRAATNKAEIEYAVMLAVLNFQTEFMKCAYSNVQTHVVDELIHVRLVRTVPIPAEQELARSSSGCMSLWQPPLHVHRSISDVPSCPSLTDRLKPALYLSRPFLKRL